MNKAPLFFPALMQDFSNVSTLTEALFSDVKLPKVTRQSVQAALAAMQQDGRTVALLKGVQLRADANAHTVVAIRPDGGCSIGTCFTHERPVLEDEAVRLRDYLMSAVRPGFSIIMVPAGVVRGVLQ